MGSPVLNEEKIGLTNFIYAAGGRLPLDVVHTRTCDHFNIGTCGWGMGFCRYPHICCLCGAKTHGYNRCPLRWPTLITAAHTGGGISIQDRDIEPIGIPPVNHRSLPDYRPVFCPKEQCTPRKDFGSYQALQRHLNRVHLNNDLFWCHICGETGPVALGGIRYHVKVCHHNVNPHPIMAKIEENLRQRGGVNYLAPEVCGPTSRL